MQQTHSREGKRERVELLITAYSLFVIRSMLSPKSCCVKTEISPITSYGTAAASQVSLLSTGIMSVAPKTPRETCCSKLKLFLVAMSFVYFSKAFCGAYMKSSITQIERRFDIPSSLIGAIDGSFEMGNLLVIAFVSYFGAKLHRPRLIGFGCVIMALGAYLTALPHFFQGPYKYETSMSHNTDVNSTETILPCLSNHSLQNEEAPSAQAKKACEHSSGSPMWIYVFLGNMLRGIGETPIMPLGVSYLDDFSREENTPFYLACIQTVGILGPMFGFMLGSFLTKVYVDIGFVDLETVTISHKDSRWVGAWWLGFIVTGTVVLLSSIPFFFLPKSLPKQGQKQSRPETKETEMTVLEQESFLPREKQEQEATDKPVTFKELAKDFMPSLRRLFRNSIFIIMVLTQLVAVNGFIGMITFKPKFMEQTFGQSASKAIFLIGILNLPAVALGVITGGFVLKRFKLGVIGAARVSITASLLSFCMLSVQVFLHCGNAEVAGLTVTYEGAPEVSYNQQTLLSQCNMGCSCSLKHWDPVCAYNKMTYASPCLAGCQISTGTGRKMVFHNCTCVEKMMSPGMNLSAVLGQCPRENDCSRSFKFYMSLSVLGSFISAVGGTPGYIVLLRSIPKDLKSLALGMQTLIVRTLGGIPPPIYFGALIDQTCLKWGTKQCGGRGACRLYDSNTFRLTFLGLVTGLYSLANALWGVLYYRIVRRQKKLALKQQEKENGLEAANGTAMGHAQITIAVNKDTEKESTI